MHLLCVIRVIECRGFMCIDMVSVHFLGVCAVWGDLGGNWVSLLECCRHVVGGLLG